MHAQSGVSDRSNLSSLFFGTLPEKKSEIVKKAPRERLACASSCPFVQIVRKNTHQKRLAKTRVGAARSAAPTPVLLMRPFCCVLR